MDDNTSSMSNPRVIPLFSSATANHGLGLAAALSRVLDSNSFVLGHEVTQFEREFAQYVGVDHCLSVANGTDALELALRAIGVVPGDRVVCVANAGFYSSTAVHLVGASPVYVDVDPQTLCMCPDALARVLSVRPAAVIATHLYGQLAPVERLVESRSHADDVLFGKCLTGRATRCGERLLRPGHCRAESRRPQNHPRRPAIRREVRRRSGCV